MDTLLLVDDDALLLETLRAHFEEQREGERPRYRVVTAPNAALGLKLAAEVGPAIVLTDLQLPDRSGLELISEFKDLVNGAPIVMMTGHHDAASTIRAMKAGAFDYLHKPFKDSGLLNHVVERALEMSRLSRRASALAVGAVAEPYSLDDIVGESSKMQAILKEIGKVAGSQANVLIQGESGTGKELVARVIHTFSNEELRPFVAINCSAIVDTLLESELFGHEKGSFTGAVVQKPGKFELAGDGTIFLDEIGDMSLALQSKVLRVLQEREFERVGGVKRIRVHARVIAATHRDLEGMVLAGRFREDLHQRLKVMTLRLPPVRERREDIPRLVRHLLVRINEKVHKRVTLIPTEVMDHLCSLPWLGNVRELENVLTRAVVLAPGDVLLRDDLPDRASAAASATSGAGNGRGVGDGQPLLSLAEVERRHIALVFEACRGHKGKTCEALRISRPTLERKLRKYRIGLHAPPATPEADPAI